MQDPKFLTNYFAFLAVLLCLSSNFLPAQNIVQVEYFLDTDPGYGNATPVSVTPAADVTVSFTANFTGLAEGFHHLFVRAQDDAGRWSLADARAVWVQSTGPLANVTALEYFIDTDPGTGNAIAVPITSGTDIAQSFAADLSGLAEGFHTLIVRAKDAAGRWSLFFRRTFFVEDAPPALPPDVTRIEYFFHKDGFFTPVNTFSNFTPGPDVSVNFAAEMSGLEVDSTYQLILAARNSSGVAGLSVLHEFTVGPDSIPAPRFTGPLPDTAFAEDTSLRVPLSTWFAFVADADTPDSSLAWEFFGTSNIAAAASADSVTFTPAPDWFGSDTLTVVVSDTAFSDTTILPLTVLPVNDAPVISGLPDTLMFPADTTATLPVWDFVADVETPDSLLSYQFFAGAPGMLTAFDPPSGVLTLSAAAGFTGAATVHITVQDDSSATAGDSLTAIVTPPLLTFQKSVRVGWNLLSLPLDPPDRFYLAIFPNAIPGTLLGFDSLYFVADTLEFGRGYWLNFDAAEVVPIAGQRIDSLTLHLTPGWHLIGGISTDVAVAEIDDPDGIITPNTLFGFEEVYLPVDTLRQGNGYWMHAGAEGVVALRAPGPLMRRISRAPAPGIDLSALPTVEIRDAAGRLQSLYVSDDYDGTQSAPPPEHFWLPPLPPPGMFDVRFAGNLRMMDGEEGEILVQGAEYPLTVRMAPPPGPASPGAQFLLQEWISGQVIATHELDAAAPVTIADPRVQRLKLRKTRGRPLQFVLAQNFPNPFNPVTKIRYGLPRPARVEITVYNTLGQVVKTLFSGRQDAGYHSIMWDGTNSHNRAVSTGLYFYRLEAGGEQRVRKMLLLK